MPANPVRSRRLLAVLLSLASLFLLTVPGVALASHHPHHHKAGPKAAAARLNHAARKARVADHRLVTKAHQLKRCRRHGANCRTQRRAVQNAGQRAHKAQARLNRIAKVQARRTQALATASAPTLSVSGDKLSWTGISGVSHYVLVTKVPGQAAQYSLVSGTSTEPPVVPGETVSYSVRADVGGSAWSAAVSITYPSIPVTQAPAPTPTTPPSVDLLAAPDLAVSGTKLQWNKVGDVTTYVLVSRVSGQADQYTAVAGTSVTPAAQSGKTVFYSVRTAIDGSAWSPSVSIKYPAVQADATPAPTAPATPAPVNGSFQMGLVSGSSPSYQLPWLQQLGTHTARIEYAVGTSAASMATVMDQYAKAGVRPLLMASFDDRLPSDAEAQNLASWAAAYGPGGTFWKGKTYAKTPGVTDIEFGNETSYSYQFSDNSLSTYAARAATYAQRAKEAAVAIRAANANVGLLAIGDNAVNQDAWVKNMFKAVPDLGDYVAGWTIHPYGPNWATRIDSTINSTKAAGSRDLPIWITEWGLSTDNGRCLDDNYGYDKCMSYSEAATTLHSVLSGMQSRYGSRLGAFFLFQANDQYATGTSTSRERYFGALQQLGAAKGAYTSEVMQDLAAN